MNEFTDLKEGKELIVRKRIAHFIEKIFQGQGIFINHDSFKKIVYSEEEPRGELEEKFKDYYDAYYYLISNHKKPFTKELLNKFFYILLGYEVDENLVIKMVNKAFFDIKSDKVDDIILFHLNMYKEMTNLKEFERTAVALMLLNYGLLKLNIPTIKIYKRQIVKYTKLRNNYFEKDDKKVFVYIYELIRTNEYQDKSYYENLTELKLETIISILRSDQKILEEKGIKSLFIFGSFAKGLNRIDSDIDLLFTFNQDKPSLEKEKTITFLKEYYFNKFNRYIDFSETNESLSDEFIKEMNKVITIFRNK